VNCPATNDLHLTNQRLQDTSVSLSHVPTVASVKKLQIQRSIQELLTLRSLSSFRRV